jgi:hypothetical protein
MSILGSFSGASIVAFPSRPGIKQIELRKRNTNAVSRSPFTGTTQVQSWPGADWWEADITLPQMVQGHKAVWSAFFGELRGALNVFYLGDPLHRHPAGDPQGTPLVSGVNVAMSTNLNTKGWKPNTFRLLLPGDYLQIGTHLHEVLDTVNSDGSGNATIVIWPSIREATTDGEAIILNNPQGLFRLTTDSNSILTTETRLSSLSFNAIEAR